MPGWTLVAISKTWPWIDEVKALSLIVKRKDVMGLVEHFERDAERICLKLLDCETFKVTIVFRGVMD